MKKIVGPFEGLDYIKKIFQVPFSLAPIAVSQLNDFMDSIYQESDLPLDQEKELRKIVTPHLRYIVSEAGVNPREVKRYINGYTLVRKIKPGLDRDACLAIQTISFRPDWEAARKGLLLYRAVFIDALRRHLDGQSDALRDLDPRLTGIPESFFRYISRNGPGRTLLSMEDVDSYIYAGEATRSSRSHSLLELIRRVAELRRMFRDFSEAFFARDDAAPQLDFQAKVYALIEMLEGSSPSPWMSPVALNDLRRVITEIPQKAAYDTKVGREKALSSWLQRGENAINQLIGSLMSFYEAGDLGAKKNLFG